MRHIAFRVAFTWLLAILLSCVVVADASAQIRIRQAPAGGGGGGDDLISQNARPRLLLTEANAATYIASFSSGGYRHSQFQALVDAVDTFWTSWAAQGGEYWGAFPSGPALVYATWAENGAPLTGVDYHGRTTLSDWAAKSIEMQQYYADNVGNTGSLYVVDLAFAYDWTFSQMTAQQRSDFADQMATVEAGLGSICAPPPNNILNAYTKTCYSDQLLFAMAIAGSGYQTTFVNTELAAYTAKFRGTGGVTAGESFYAGTTGGTSAEGMNYDYYTFFTLFPAEESYRRIYGISAATHYGGADAYAIRYYPMKLLNEMVPWGPLDGGLTGGREYTIYTPFRAFNNPSMTLSWFALYAEITSGILASVDSTQAGLAAWLVANRTGTTYDGVIYAIKYSVQKLLMGPTSAPTVISPTTAGLSLRTTLQDEAFIFRSAWDDLDSPWVRIAANRWCRGLNIRNLETGTVTIHRNGPQMVRKGNDDGSSWASNGPQGGALSQMAFPDRTVDEAQTLNDDEGATRRCTSNPQVTTDMTTNSTWDFLSDLRSSLANGSTIRSNYIGQNLTRSYDSDAVTDLTYNPTRISFYYKDVVYWEPATYTTDPVIVVERERTTTKGTNFVQTKIMLTSGDPTSNGSSSAGPARNPPTCTYQGGNGTWYCPPSGTHGHTTYTGATLVTATQSANGQDGKVWISPLLPATATVVIAGGPDEGSNAYNCVAEHSLEWVTLYGERICANVWGNAWRKQLNGSYNIQITNPTPVTSDLNITVTEVTDAGGSQSTTTLQTNGAGGDDFICARTGTKVACFGEDGESKTSGDFILNLAAGTYEVILVNLNPSAARTFTIGSNITSITKIEDSDTDLTYTADAAGVLHLSFVFSAAGSGAANTTTVN